MHEVNYKNPPAWVHGNPYLAALEDRFFSDRRLVDWSTLPLRVERLFYSVESGYRSPTEAMGLARELRALVHDGAFFPNSPVMMNSEQADRGNFFACYVLSAPLDVDKFAIAKSIHDGCGGIGYDLSDTLDPVALTDAIEQETCALNPARKRKAHSAVTLSIGHPLCSSFISLGDRLSATHTNVEVSDEFLQAVEAGDRSARSLWQTLCASIHTTGKPAIAFESHKARRSPNGERLILNLCGESPLRENESALVGTLNLARFIAGDLFEEDDFVRAVHLAVLCLDNLHELQEHASLVIAQRSGQSRKIGVGIMGYADALLLLGIRYGSDDALGFGQRVMGLLRDTAYEASEKRARERGACDPALQGDDGRPPRRNASLLAIAANGTLSLLANTTGGIEPIFGLLVRQSIETSGAVYQLQPTLSRLLSDHGVDATDIDIVTTLIAAGVPATEIAVIPEPLRRALVTAHELSVDEHIRTQSTFQAFLDGAISKTINLPCTSTEQDVSKAILSAWAQGCVGISLYRNGSVSGQPTQVAQTSRHPIAAVL